MMKYNETTLSSTDLIDMENNMENNGNTNKLNTSFVTIFVGGVPINLGENEIMKLFKQYVDVTYLKLK